ncbi:MAG: hypothetical protein M1476_01320 [Candidatus Thermoplasmatota archaeon]|nr:hypothetical protein [Candidatus Thermoplasmatota archaeon]
MKTLTYGSLKINLDLDPRQEEIFVQVLEIEIAAARKHQAWLRREALKGSDSPVKGIKPSRTINSRGK